MMNPVSQRVQPKLLGIEQGEIEIGEGYRTKQDDYKNFVFQMRHFLKCKGTPFDAYTGQQT